MTFHVLHFDSGQRKSIPPSTTQQRTIEDAPTMDQINGLVRKAFGFSWVGNYLCKYVSWEDIECHTTKNPSQIRFVPPVLKYFYSKYAGSFLTDNGDRAEGLPNDGSKLLLEQGYEKEGKRYAQIYEELTGRTANVRVKD